MKILVPLDGSVLAESVLAPAVRLARGGAVELVRVVSPDMPADQRETVQAYLEDHRAALVDQGLDARWFLEDGDPAERILVIAGEQAPDLIAMATHGDSGFERGVRGSVAERVLRESALPVFLVNPRGVPQAQEPLFQELLVPLDGSDLSAGVLPYVEHLARTYGSHIVLLIVNPSAGLAMPFDPEEARSLLEPQRKRLSELGLRVSTMAVPGNEAEEILNASRTADLVCMSTHGRSGISRWWFGSVAEQVLRTCPSPLLVVRPKRE